MTTRNVLLAVLGGAAASLAMAPSAFGLGLTNLSSQPAETPAGAHSDFSQHIEITSPSDDLKKLVVHLPPGQVGDPTATPKCTEAQLNANQCPANTQVGVTTTTADLVLVAVPVEQEIPGKVYNVTAHPGEPARFGIVLTPSVGDPVILQATASLRQSDFGLDTTIDDIPNTAAGGLVPIDIKQLDLTLFGFANDGTAEEKPFMRNPTSCDEAVTGFEATSYTGGTATTPATGSASFTPTNCGALDFSPELSATTGGAGQTGQGGHPFYTTIIEQAVTEAGLEQADVTLPAGITADNNALGNQCPVATFRSGTCPPNTIVGTTEASSPLLSSPLTGTVALLSLEDSNLGVGIELQGELEMKLVGKLGFAGGGRAKNLFEGLPDIPISRFELTVAESGLLITTADLCQGPELVTDGILDGHNGDQTVLATPTPVEGCGPPAPPTVSLRLRKASTDQPELDVDVDAGGNAIEKVQVKVPRRYRLAKGDAFTDGAEAIVDGSTVSDAILTRRRHKVVMDPAAAGDSADLRLHDGALRPADGRGKRFKVKVTDGDDQVFPFTLTP